MPQSLSNILVHLVFGTKNRARLILPPVEGELWRYLAATCAAHGCQAHEAYGDAGRPGGNRYLDTTDE